MNEKRDGNNPGDGAEFFAELEDGTAPLAGAPRHFQRKGSGYPDLAGERVRDVVLEALLATGYDRALAEKMATEVAKTLPSIQKKAEAQVA